MKKKQILNVCMVLTIIVVAVCGVMAVGSVKGWFGGHNTETDMVVAERTGIAMIERSSVAYEVNEGTALREEDRLYTKTAAALTLAKADGSGVYLGANAEVEVKAADRNVKLEVLKGEALVDARTEEPVTILSRDTEVVFHKAMAMVSTQAGSTQVYVYAGEVTVGNGTEEAIVVSAGKAATLAEGDADYQIANLSAASLSDAQITQLLRCDMNETFCFTAADLKKVQADREAEILEAQQEAIRQKEEARKAALEAQKEAEAKNADQTAQDSANDSDTQASTGETAVTSESVDDTYEDEDLYEEEEKEPEEESLSCTIKIVCDTILDNMENLAEGKEGYVPSSGKILGTTSVDFEEGETVFDVLQRVCDSAGIQLEYSWTPMYDSYYIEGINHLYEFDCGNESGWMYKVNGWFPNYGCSSYELQDGDTIVWCYTCNGLGADVGGGNF